MRRLYLSIYLGIIASLVAFVLVAGAAWRFGAAQGPMGQGAEFAAEFVAATLPDETRPAEEQRRAVDMLARRLRADITLFDAARRPIAVAGREATPPRPRAEPLGLVHDRDGPAWSVQLPDGRWLVARLPARHRNPLIGLVIFLALVAGLVGLCAYPVARGLTRRIERLQRGVETLGAGDLRARVEVEGKDEVAQLARGFNVAAARIEELVGAHRMLLANASHELRTPLSRIRLGLELARQTGEEKYRAAVEADLRELEEMIEEILLASRLDANAGPREIETLDLLALAAEEAARYDEATTGGASVMVSGESRLLRRLVRNLLENARRHGRPPVEVNVRVEKNLATLTVSDAGAGVPMEAREKVFEPFYQAGGDRRGSGLGLALVRRIARLHGGEARVIDAASGGAFQVTLPVARG